MGILRQNALAGLALVCAISTQSAMLSGILPGAQPAFAEETKTITWADWIQADTAQSLQQAQAWVVPANVMQPVFKPQATSVLAAGDTVVIKPNTACWQKQTLPVGSVPPTAQTLSLQPASLRFVVQCADSRALRAIKTDLSQKGFTVQSNSLVKKPLFEGELSTARTGRSSLPALCLVTLKVAPAANAKLAHACPMFDAEKVNNPRLMGWYEPEWPREGQASFHADVMAQPTEVLNAATLLSSTENQTLLKTPIKLALIDSGVDLSQSALQNTLNTNPKQAWNFVDNTDTVQDWLGSGTALAGLISRMNPNVQLISLKVLDLNNQASSIDTARAIRYAADHGAKVIVIGVTGRTPSFAEKIAVDYANQKGSLVVAAAGNRNESMNYAFPATLPGVLAVGALNATANNVWQKADFSNTGRQIDLSAPGVKLPVLPAVQTAFTGTGSIAGTAPASAIVGGLASLVWSAHPDFNASQLERVLTNTAQDLDATGKDVNTGYGLVNPQAALKADPAYYLDAEILAVRPVKSRGPNKMVEVFGTVGANQLKSIQLKMRPKTAAADETTTTAQAPDNNWQPVPLIESLKASPKNVTKSAVAKLPLKTLQAQKEWEFVLVAEHKNGTQREAHYTLKVNP